MKKEARLPFLEGRFHLHVIHWIPDQTPYKAVIHLVHGISEYLNRYEDFATYLTAHGFVVVGCDLPGHGLSAPGPEDYGYFAPKDGWRLVTRALLELADSIQEEYPDLPFFLMGHSMGSFLVRTMMIDRPNLARGVILSGTGQLRAKTLAIGSKMTGLAVRAWGPRARSRRIEHLSTGSYHRQFDPFRTVADWISRDPAVVDRYLADPLCTFRPTVSLFRDIIDGLRYIGDHSRIARMNPNIPYLIFSGDHDPVGENGEGVRRVFYAFIRAGFTSVRLKLYPEGRHEMLNELNRDEVYEDVLAWLNKYLEAPHAV